MYSDQPVRNDGRSSRRIHGLAIAVSDDGGPVNLDQNLINQAERSVLRLPSSRLRRLLAFAQAAKFPPVMQFGISLSGLAQEADQ